MLQAKLGREHVYRMYHRHALEPSKVTVLSPLNDITETRKAVSTQASSDSRLGTISKGTFWQPTSLLDIRPSYLQAIPSELKEQVTILSGPERITSGWWEFAPTCRDYYVAENQQGKKLWIFRTPNQQWFVHGYFS